MQCNIYAWFKGHGKYNDMYVKLSDIEKEKLQAIEGTYMKRYLKSGTNYNTPLKGVILRVKIPDKSLIYLGEGDKLKNDDKLRLTIKLKVYDFNGFVGYNYSLVSCVLA